MYLCMYVCVMGGRYLFTGWDLMDSSSALAPVEDRRVGGWVGGWGTLPYPSLPYPRLASPTATATASRRNTDH